MGLLNKTIDIQKKQRSDVIISINKKYAFATGDKTSIIQKKRTEFDQRTFEYFIEPAKFRYIAPLISS